jgi:hypothetical protein
MSELCAPYWEHESFHLLLQCCPAFGCMRAYLRDEARFSGEVQLRALYSSYRKHGYGHFFYSLVRAIRPSLCVELGVLEGYSLLATAAALRDNGIGVVHAFDLFQAYPYRHEKQENVLERIRQMELCDQTKIECADAFAVPDRFNQVDLLHVDLSNDGRTYRHIFAQWANKARTIVLEGGSTKRDSVHWMVRYGKPAIVPAIEEICAMYPDWKLHVLEPFPSITVAVKTT